jgi:hypothetical protein
MRSELFGAFLLFLMWDFLDFSLLYSTLFHLPPLRFHCVGETQVRYDYGIGWETCSARKLSNDEIIAPLYWRTKAFLRKWRCGSNSERKLSTIFDFVDFFLFGPHFYLRSEHSERKRKYVLHCQMACSK